VKIIGAYYPEGFSTLVIPASFILLTTELFLLFRILHRCKKNLETAVQ